MAIPVIVYPVAALAATALVLAKKQKDHPGAPAMLLKSEDFDHIPGAWSYADINQGVKMRVRGVEYGGTVVDYDSSDPANDWTVVRIDTGPDGTNLGHNVRLARDQMIDVTPVMGSIVEDLQAMPMTTKLLAVAAIAAVGAVAIYGTGAKPARR